jgi:hypothetical protein
MPIYDTYDGVDGQSPPATASTDSEYKYVNVRRYDLAEEVAPDALVADGADAPAGGGGGGAGKVSWNDLGVLLKPGVEAVGALEAEASSATGHVGEGGGPHVKVLDGADGGTAPDLVVETDPAAAIGTATTVLAWAKGDPLSQSAGGDDYRGTIELDSFSWGTAAPSEAGLVKGGTGTLVLGNDSSVAGGGGDDVLIGGTTTYDAPHGATFNGGIPVAAGDDVVVDGRIITGQDPAAAEHELVDLLGFPHDHDARGEILTLGFTAVDWGAAAADAGGLQVMLGDGSVRFDPF